MIVVGERGRRRAEQNKRAGGSIARLGILVKIRLVYDRCGCK
jgi:hypothetical protein